MGKASSVRVLSHAVALAGCLVVTARVWAHTIERVSVGPSGVQGDNESTEYWGWHGSISPDGRYAAFSSKAANLVAGDTNAVSDVFIRDRTAGTTVRVSLTNAGGQANGASYWPSISADGSRVAFCSDATNLVSGDTNSWTDVFVRDLSAGATTRVSVSSTGTQGNDASRHSWLSAAGRYVAFESYANTLVSGDTNGMADIFVHDLVNHTTERVNLANDGSQAGAASYGSVYPCVSSDGRYVAFQSYASNLVAGDTNNSYDDFVRDRTNGTTERVSVTSDGAQGNDWSFIPRLSANGRYVAFYSRATNLVSNDTNASMDCFVRDRTAGTTVRVSVATDGTQGNGGSDMAAISADGSTVAFESVASNLVAGDTNGAYDIFLRHVPSGMTARVNLTNAGAQSAGLAWYPCVDGTGLSVLFYSTATDLVPSDTNGYSDAFVATEMPLAVRWPR